jgi:outer membrane protein assembly factor BamB
MPKLSALLVIILAATLAFAEGTRTWQQSSFDDFEKGTTSGIAITSDGSLELAPSFRSLYLTPSTYTWAMDTDSEGNAYVAAGSPARVYRITPQGSASVIFAPQELQVQTLVVGPHNTVYVGTSPDGKVYRIERKRVQETQAAPQSKGAVTVDPNYSSAVLFNPGTKYIWALALDKQGNLYVATGDRGEIFKVASNGEHSLFFKSDEAHIRVLAFDLKGDLIAGSDGSGLVYRISPDGQAFVLYSAPKKEITALAVDKNGNIYAAAVGEKRSQPAGAVPVQVPVVAMPSGAQMGMSLGPAVSTPNPVLSIPSFATAGGSEIYRIAPDGSPLTLWSSRDDLVYALAFDNQGHLLAGTGNKGHIYAITGTDEFTDLLKAPANQVTAFAKAPQGGLYACTSNFGKVFVLGPQPQTEGSYESDVFDAHIFSRWGRTEVRSTGPVDLYARSGNVDNPDRNWSAWQKVDLADQGAVSIPSARFVQWKAVLHDGRAPARVDSVLVNYLPKNVAPQIDDITVQVGMRYQPLPKPAPEAGTPPQGNTPLPPPIHDRDSIAVHWAAHDDNDDQLVYSLYYRGDGDSRWLPLKKNLDDRYYSFDASLLPDGGYTIKVVASDAPSHSPNEALSSSQESSRFEVDTTPPAIQELRGALAGNQVRVTFRAVDGFSPIKRAEYSIDAKDWQYIEPVGQISDSKTENYDFSIPVSAPDSQEHVVVVRAYDRFDNMGAAKFVLRPRGAAAAGK